jgi:molybdate transport system ATP-binding protein
MASGGMTLSIAIRRRLSAQFDLDVAFDVPPGVTILFGASGSGKSSVLRAVAGLARPDRGRIAIGDTVFFEAGAGRHVTDVPVERRRVGYVFQQLALFPHMSIGDNIAYGLHGVPAGARRARVAAIARSFRIADTLDRTPAQTSGGERQRAALARALVTNPSVLLLDEPLSALDHAMQSHIMDDLRRWNDAHGIPVLYVTHAHREVFALGAHVIALDRGRVVATGSPHDVLDQPALESLASLAGFENVFDAVVTERREAAGTMQCRLGGSGTVVHPPEPGAPAIEAPAPELETPLSRGAVGDRVRVAIRAGDILLSRNAPAGLSARNILPGRVRDATRVGATMVLVVESGCRFTVHLTPGGYDSLGLRAGAEVWMIIKTYSCRIVAR